MFELESDRLGRLLSEHRYSKRVVLKDIGIIAFIIAWVSFFEFLWRNFPVWLKYISTVVVLATILWFVWAIVKAVLSQIRIYEHGLEYQFGRRVTSCLWSEISGLKIRRRILRNYHYLVFTIITVGDYGIYIGDENVLRIYATYHRQFELDWWIKEKISTFFVPRYRRALQKGDVLTFGSITLTKEQVRRGKKQILWSEVSNLRWPDELSIVLYRHNASIFERNFGYFTFNTVGLMNSHVLYYLMYWFVSDAMGRQLDESGETIEYKGRLLNRGRYSRDYIDLYGK